jgi:hypothetical protein
MSLDYRDAYLKDFCSYEVETLAYSDVDLLGTFTTAWRNKLAIVRAYILVCQENQANDEDLFTAKLKTYEKEFEGLLARARTASPDDDGNYAPIYSIPLERA